MNLERDGWALVTPELPSGLLQEARDTLFHAGQAGERCLLDAAVVKTLASLLRSFLQQQGICGPDCMAIQAIAFDKTADTNWKVPWHQDLMFPLAREVQAEGFSQPSLKEGIPYACPPFPILRELLAARLHLDDCDAGNGPLRVAPGSHLEGIIPSGDCGRLAREYGETACLAKEGEVLLMRPLTLHASSQATSPRHRRVLHFVFCSGAGSTAPWHRAVI